MTRFAWLNNSFYKRRPIVKRGIIDRTITEEMHDNCQTFNLHVTAPLTFFVIVFQENYYR